MSFVCVGVGVCVCVCVWIDGWMDVPACIHVHVCICIEYSRGHDLYMIEM